ncbi:MAG: ABC transporter permease, partial [Candidatus Bipolaricaulota bacterium]
MWIVFANAKKRKARLVMTVAGIAIGVATLFALLASSAGIQRGLEREIGGLGAHILLLPVGCPYTLTLALMQGTDTLAYIPQDRLTDVRAASNVRLAVPVVVGRVRVNDEMTPLYGTTDEILQLKQWGVTRLDGAVVGSDAATRLGLSVGSRITLSFYARHEVEVIRVLPRTGGRDDT